jgi:gamma-glutamyltranspeptidase
LPDIITVEKEGFNAATQTKITEIGHQIKETPSIGRVDAILIKKKRKIEGAADPRDDDAAIGY